MRIFVYSCRDFDEDAYFARYSREYGVELGICRDAPTLENAHLAKGYDAVSILTTPVDGPLVEEFHRLGVRMISTRTVGYDHVDCVRAKELGVQVSNATYPADSVAEYTVMLMMMTIRRMKRILERAALNDFSLKGNQGRILTDYTVGVVGTGKIGRRVVELLSGFGCTVLAYDLYESEEVKAHAQYVSLDEIYARCGLITFHMPLNEQNFHMVSAESIARMRDGVVLISTARGGLIDSAALIAGLESGKIGGAGLDVVENEFDLYYYDRKADVFENHELFILRGFPNVVVTPHMAFYTDSAVSNMVLSSVKSCVLMEEGKENPWRVV